jgi:hypothetical protein
LPEKFVNKHISKQQNKEFLVWFENLEPLELYQSCADQWRIVSSMSGFFYQGLENTAILSAMDMLETPKNKRKHLLFEVKLIAQGAAEVHNGK